MPVRRCFGCEQKLTGKPVSIYGAWMSDDERVSYLMRLCMDCVFENLAKPVRIAIADEDGKMCSVCEGPFDGEPRERMFITAFLPKQEMEQFELVGHVEHITRLQAWFEEYGIIPADRGLGGSRGPVTTQVSGRGLPW